MSFRGELRSVGARLLQEIAAAAISAGILAVLFGLLPWLAGLRQTRWLVLGLLAWLTACALEQGLRAGTRSFFYGRTIGLLFFAAGCWRFGVFTYASADWPVWLELIGAVAALRWAEGKKSIPAAAAAGILPPFVAGLNIVLGLALALTIVTPSHPAARYFEAAVVRWYAPVMTWLKPGTGVFLGCLGAAFLLQYRLPKLHWLQGLLAVKGWASKTAATLAVVASCIFTGSGVVSEHANTGVVQLASEYQDKISHIALAETQARLAADASSRLASGTNEDRTSLIAFLDRVDRQPPGIVRDGLVDAVAGEVAAENLGGTTSSASAQAATAALPAALRVPAATRDEEERQVNLVAAKTAEEAKAVQRAAAAQTAAKEALLVILSAAEPRVRDLAPKFLEALVNQYAKEAIDRHVTPRLGKELWLPRSWRADAQTGAPAAVERGAHDVLERVESERRARERAVIDREARRTAAEHRIP